MQKSSYKLLVGAAAIDKAIASIKKRGDKLDRDIQVAALSAMQHHAEHGDVTIINRLVAAMPKSSRVNALREYIQCFGGVTYNSETKLFMHVSGKEFDLEAASEKMWTAYKPEPEYVPFDALAAITNLVKKLDKADALKGDKVTDEQAAAIRKLAAELGAKV